MFDFAWTEIALIGVVALVAIGPKDLPVAIQAVTDMIKKARRMAGEFQTHVDEMMKEANLDEVRSQINEIRSLDVKGAVQRAIDPDGALGRTFAEDPLAPSPTYVPPPASPAAETLPEPEVLQPAIEAPAFVPPELVPPPPRAVAPPPAFIPPDTTPPAQG
jgi:sec-independent protein translocase protein TatB